MVQNAPDLPRNMGVRRAPFPWPFAVVVHRFALFLVWQAAIAAIFALRGAYSPWQSSVAWWPVAATLTNLVSIGLLRLVIRREGVGWARFIGVDFGRDHLRSDLLALLALLLAAGPVSMLPNFGLAQLLFGDVNTAVGLYILPLPRAVALTCLVLFPLTIAFAELPSYYGFAMPRLAARWGKANPWAVLVPAFWLSAQHMMLPFIPDVRFVLYRLGMFFPFALLLGFAIRWRPRLLPYMMAFHALMDLLTMLMVWQVAVGG